MYGFISNIFFGALSFSNYNFENKNEYNESFKQTELKKYINI